MNGSSHGMKPSNGMVDQATGYSKGGNSQTEANPGTFTGIGSNTGMENGGITQTGANLGSGMGSGTQTGTTPGTGGHGPFNMLVGTGGPASNNSGLPLSPFSAAAGANANGGPFAGAASEVVVRMAREPEIAVLDLDTVEWPIPPVATVTVLVMVTSLMVQVGTLNRTWRYMVLIRPMVIQTRTCFKLSHSVQTYSDA